MRTIGLVFNPEKPETLAEYKRLRRWLASQGGLRTVGGPRITPVLRAAEFVIAIGGDGTVLKAARQVARWNIPVLGVHVGRLGFLAASDPSDVTRVLERALRGECRIETRTLVSATAATGGRKRGPFLALNDCVVRSSDTGRVLRIRVSVGKQPLAHYAGDGVIIATPTGSTAYNLAASGPIVYPDVDVFLVTPICPHSLLQRPLVLPSFESITIEVEGPNPPALLSLDGQTSQVLRSGDRVDIRRAGEQARLIMSPERSFYRVLQTKLGWGQS